MKTNRAIIDAVKRARTAKGLSQAELGHHIGVPQSHISKIEKGDVDIKLSSLTQIARALDLEVKLVPRKALPVVESIVKDFPRDRTAAALSEIRKALALVDRVGQISKLPGNVLATLEIINQDLEGLRTLNYDTDAFLRLHHKLAEITKFASSLDPSNFSGDVSEAPDQASRQFKNLHRYAAELQRLHHILAHAPVREDISERPTYSLDDEDE